MDLTDLNVLCDDPRDQRPPRASSAGTVAAKRPHPHLNQDSPTAAPGLAHASPSHGTAGSPGVASSPRLPAPLAKLAADMAALQALADDLSARVPPSAAAELHALGPLRQVRASTVGAAALPRLLVRGMGWGGRTMALCKEAFARNWYNVLQRSLLHSSATAGAALRRRARAERRRRRDRRARADGRAQPRGRAQRSREQHGRCGGVPCGGGEACGARDGARPEDRAAEARGGGAAGGAPASLRRPPPARWRRLCAKSR